MSIKDTDDEILLYTAENAESTLDEATLGNITGQITQTHKWKHSRKDMCIYADKILGINDFNGKTVKKFWINLVHIDPEPSRVRTIGWKSHLVAMLFLTVGFLLIAHKHLNILTEVSFNYQASSAVILITLAILISLLASYRSTNELKFFTAHGQVPVFSMLYNKPSKKTYQSFLNQTISSIKTAKTKDYYNPSEQLAMELGEHRRLKDEGIISAEVYETAKNNIMQCH